MADDLKDRINKMPPFDPQEEQPTPPPQDNPPVEQPKEDQPQKQVKEEEVKEETKPQKEEPKLPEDVKERTKQEFEKLKQHNQELKETIKKYTDVLTSLSPQEVAPPNQFTPYFEPILTKTPPQSYPGLTKEQIQETFDNLVDEQGYVDVNLLKEELRKQRERAALLEQRAKEAEALAKQAAKTVDDFQRTQKMKEVHAKYPQIDPESPQFDERMWEAVRNEIIGQWMTTGKEDVEAAAKKWYNILYPMAKDKQAEKKAQINAIPTTPTSTSTNFEDHKALVEATRKNKKGALAERLRRAGY
jgi:ribosome-binding protein aMBF1 (putative translation factor)